MIGWMYENTTLLQILVSIVSTIVWLFYLQLFLVSFMRQRRPEILVSRGAGVGLDARCYIANLSLEPIYVSQLLMTIVTDDGDRLHAAITDRDSMSPEQMEDPRQATNQGPVKSGDSFDAGSFRDLVNRGLRINDREADSLIESFELTIVALHAASSSFIGAKRKYDCVEIDDYKGILPDTLTTRQLRGPIARWRLKRQLERDLAWYRS